MLNEQVLNLSARLAEIERETPDYWTFDGDDRRVGAHALFHYPAMMVPQMQGAILDLVREVAPSCRSIYDPFLGSGTTLVEAMKRGLDFTGTDINPLAVLISSVKSHMVAPIELEAAEARIAARIKDDKGTTYTASFANQQKWFSKSASIALSRISRSIAAEDSVYVRRVFWIALARIVRATCNSRTSTYKLHIKPKLQTVETVDALAQFERHGRAVVHCLNTHYEILRNNGVLTLGKYAGEIQLSVADILSENNKVKTQADVVITSPPYGDNQTTITYGQYSYLPLSWIPLDDIASGLTRDSLRSTHATDSASLGGSLVEAVARGRQECEGFAAFAETMNLLRENINGQKRFSAFAADLRQSIAVLAGNTKSGGFHVWTVGERRICGVRVPMSRLVGEMLASEDIHLVHAASRRILSKRMAIRNTLSETMAAEQVLIARRR